jgi:hypothetical protein
MVNAGCGVRRDQKKLRFAFAQPLEASFSADGQSTGSSGQADHPRDCLVGGLGVGW